MWSALAALALARDDVAEAARIAEEGMLLANRTVGARTPHGGHLTELAGTTALANGQPRLAVERFTEAISIFEELSGPEHPVVASLHAQRGEAFAALEDFEHARTDYRAALAVERASSSTRAQAHEGLAACP